MSNVWNVYHSVLDGMPRSNQFVNFVVRISHGLCFLYKAIQLFYQ